MNRIVMAILACLCAGALEARQPVSFDETVEAHAAGELEAARTAFRRMAEAGRVEAQFNLGAMLANAEGGPADVVEGALWITLASEAGFDAAEQAAPIISEALDEAERDEFRQRLPDWRNSYARDELLARFTPRFCGGCEVNDVNAREAEQHRLETLLEGKRLTVEREAPSYPREAARSGAMGEVLIGAWLNEEGEIEQPHIQFADPEGVFDEAALRAFSRWDFDWVGEPPEGAPFYIVQQIRFQLDGAKERAFDSMTRRQLREDVRNWDEDVLAAYQAAWTLDFMDEEVDPDNPAALVEVTYQAAYAGIIRAQLDLAERFRCGDNVAQSTPANHFWLKQAAFEGVPRAQFLLSIKDSTDPEFAAALRSSAAENGFLPATLAEIRHQVEHGNEVDQRELAALIDSLPDRWRKHHGDGEVMRRAKAIAEL
ncbi:TonB family protein [Wenzhouxiangella sediminis]|uniref:TonB family protein n=1 Tax=Wenzhouxiangella sediminis TaxID=1792836 RepID=A0A3E1KC64_9GAMM|nr:TonB family protein [Wenzhouxiangella sediminis]RFF32299.1 TonB family protein [Wenzhouxiangella sediminis]